MPDLRARSESPETKNQDPVKKSDFSHSVKSGVQGAGYVEKETVHKAFVLAVELQVGFQFPVWRVGVSGTIMKTENTKKKK